MEFPSYQLREELFENKGINSIVDKCKAEGDIQEFDNKLWKKIDGVNVFTLRNFTQIFEEGFNIGTCGLTVKYLSFLFEKFKIVSGKCEMLIGTKGAENGEHTWLESDGFIYDTTLLLKITKKTGYERLGYVCQSIQTSRELFEDERYMLEKKIAINKEMVEWKKNLEKEFKNSPLVKSLDRL